MTVVVWVPVGRSDPPAYSLVWVAAAGDVMLGWRGGAHEKNWRSLGPGGRLFITPDHWAPIGFPEAPR